MSYYARGTEGDIRNRSHHGQSRNLLEKRREIEKVGRQNQYVEQKKNDEPLFPQPRKMSEQDLLGKSINNVLGDPEHVSGILLREPNIWLGTSRSSQGLPTPASGQGLSNTSSANAKSYSNSHRGADSSHTIFSRDASDRSSQTYSGRQSSEYRSNEIDHKNIPRSKQQCGDVSEDRHGQSHNRNSAVDLGNSHPTLPRTRTSAEGQNLQLLPNLKDFSDSTIAGISRSDRDRIPSMDSDLLSRVDVENILEEMVDLPPSITGIKTPSVSELKNFNFQPSSQRKKHDAPGSGIESLNTDALDVAATAAASDADSSDDSSEDETNETDWNLSSFSKQSKSRESRNIPSNSNKKKSNACNQNYPDDRSSIRRKVHLGTDYESQHTDVQRSFKDDKTLSSSSFNPPKCKSKSSSSSRLHTSPRQRQSETKGIHSGTKQSKPPLTKRHRGSFSSTRADSSIHDAKRRPSQESSQPPHKSEWYIGSRKLHKLGHKSVSAEANEILDKKKSGHNLVAETRTKSNLISSSSLDYSSGSKESDDENISEGENSHSGFSNPGSPNCDNVSIPCTVAKSQRLRCPRRQSCGSQLEENNADNASEPGNACWNNDHFKTSDEELKPSRTNLPSSSFKKKSTDPCEKKVPHTLKTSTVKHNTAHADPSTANIQSSRCSLWVKLKSSLLPSNIDEIFDLKSKQTRNQEPTATILNTIDVIPSMKRQIGMVSTGSETEQPVRRADRVQVAIADGSTDWKDGSCSINKRKFTVSEQNYDSHLRKRQRMEKSPCKQQNRSFPSESWRGTSNTKYIARNPSDNAQPMVDSNDSLSSSLLGQESPHFSNPLQRTSANGASIVLPDSSVPGEQERIQTSDWYMREGKKSKHRGDGMVNDRTGRTRSGEALNRALAYFEASLFFIISGHVMENEERSETGSSSSTSASHSPTNMYQQTLPLLDFVLKMRPLVEQDDRIFKRITISCLKCQAFLYLRIFKLKKDSAVKYSEVLTEQFKTMSKSAQTYSPWRNANAAPNVLSPMSPAVPSPFTHHGPSPASNHGDQVSSSTQAGKMTPTSHSSYNLPQKMYDTYQQHHAIMCNLLHAHEKWDQGESMLEEHVDFFRNIDALCNRTLAFHSCLRDVFLYYKMVLHQLRALRPPDWLSNFAMNSCDNN